jgi:hypothetical protein
VKDTPTALSPYFLTSTLRCLHENSIIDFCKVWLLTPPTPYPSPPFPYIPPLPPPPPSIPENPPPTLRKTPLLFKPCTPYTPLLCPSPLSSIFYSLEHLLLLGGDELFKGLLHELILILIVRDATPQLPSLRLKLKVELLALALALVKVVLLLLSLAQVRRGSQFARDAETNS